MLKVPRFPLAYWRPEISFLQQVERIPERDDHFESQSTDISVHDMVEESFALTDNIGGSRLARLSEIACQAPNFANYRKIIF
jgi:hypothetical protein